MSSKISKSYEVINGIRQLKNKDVKHTSHFLTTETTGINKFNSRKKELTKLTVRTNVIEIPSKTPNPLFKRSFSQKAKKRFQTIRLGLQKIKTILHVNNR